MPSVELRRRRQFAAPADSGKRGTSAAQGLAKALGLVEDVVTDEGMRVFEAERQRVDDLLSSPTITDAEAAEVAASTRYLENQTRALNRQGEVRAEREYDRIVEELDKTPDVLTARNRLRELQAEISEGLPPRVAAGVAERFAQYAPNLLQQASARRQAQLEETERVELSEDFLSSATSRGVEGFIGTYAGALTDEIATGGTGDQAQELSLTSIENFHLEGEGLGQDGANPRLSATLDLYDGLLAHPATTEGAFRKKVLEARKRVISAEEVRLRRANTGTVDEAPFNTLFGQVSRLSEQGLPIPVELADQARAEATRIGSVAISKLSSVLTREQGIAHTDEAKSGRDIVSAHFRNVITNYFDKPIAMQETLSFYDKLLRGVKRIEDPLERIRLSQALAKEAIEYGEALLPGEGDFSAKLDLKSGSEGREDLIGRLAQETQTTARSEIQQFFSENPDPEVQRAAAQEGGAIFRQMEILRMEEADRRGAVERQLYIDTLTEASQDAGLDPNNIIRPRLLRRR
jgi:hypothetical protein